MVSSPTLTLRIEATPNAGERIRQELFIRKMAVDPVLWRNATGRSEQIFLCQESDFNFSLGATYEIASFHNYSF